MTDALLLMRAATTLELVLELQRQRGRMSKVTVEDIVRVTTIVDDLAARAALAQPEPIPDDAFINGSVEGSRFDHRNDAPAHPEPGLRDRIEALPTLRRALGCLRAGAFDDAADDLDDLIAALLPTTTEAPE